jgi:hypothetical protein
VTEREKGMAKATTCTLNGRTITIAEALALRTKRGLQGSLRCIECGEKVRAHRKGTTDQAAHFEHHVKNPKCSRSA